VASAAYSDATGAGTPLADGKEVREINGRTHVLEYPSRVT